MTAPVRVGVIGMGVGEQLARAFATHPDAVVVALCDRDVARCDRLSDILPGARHYDNAERLIDDPELEAVAIASQDDDHYGQVIRALDRGLHVFCEKPLCLSFSELQHIAGMWHRSGRRLTTNTVLRRSARFLWLYEAVRSGRLGQIYCLEADYIYGRLHKIVHGWRGRIPDYSPTLGGAIHLVDLVLWLTGEYPVEVSAYASGRGSRGTGFNGIDLVAAVLYFESGIIAKVGANFAAIHPHYHRLTVYGTDGTFDNSPDGPGRLWTGRDATSPPEPVHAAYPGVGKGDLVPSFLDALHAKGEPDITEREVFAAVAVCLAIDDAAATHRARKIDYVTLA